MALHDETTKLCRGCGRVLPPGGTRLLGICVHCVATPSTIQAIALPTPGYHGKGEAS